MIEIKDVSLKYRDGTIALNPFDLNIRPGELVYVTGPSGSGKTSLIKLIMGMEYPTTGTLSVLRQPITGGQTKNIRNMRKKIGPVFQEFKLIQGRTALENVMTGMRFLGISPRKMKRNTLDALMRVGLEHKVNSLVENLSWGEGQRVAIARAVARKPALILADEPTGNLDYENALNIIKLLASFKDQKTTVIITTHATHLIREIGDAAHIRINKGNITVERRNE